MGDPADRRPPPLSILSPASFRGKKMHRYHIAQDCNRETSMSEVMYTSFVLTHCTPQTSENVP